ncbi:hypothetical protein TNCV_512791 [Trichonephila clavipes]|nr:hypothetical protein TNCV_512791 [Trichonephila clavipes]
MCPKRLYTVCLETIVPVAEESGRDRSDAALRLFLMAVTAKYIPVLIRGCNLGAICAVTSTHIIIISDRCQSLEVTLWVIPNSLDTSSWVRPHSSHPIILPYKNHPNAFFVPKLCVYLLKGF